VGIGNIAVITSIGIGAVSRGARIKEDTAIGIIFAGMFALGIALISTVRAYTVDLTHFLFGNILGVRTTDLWQMIAFGSLIIIVVLAFYKEFLVLSFDPVLARTLRLTGQAAGLPADRIDRDRNRGFLAGGWGCAGGGYAGDAGRDCFTRHSPLAGVNDNSGSNRCFFWRYRTLFFLLF
jgi:hypothetical protein